MGFCSRLAVILLVVSVVSLSLTEAQRGRGRGRNRGQQGPPPNRGQGGDGGQSERGTGGPGGRGPGGQGQRGPGGRGPGGQGQRGPGGQGQRRPEGRGPGGRGRPNAEPPAGDLYTWNQTLSTGDVVVQRVFLPENKSVLISGSRGDRESGFMPSRTLYDFSSASGVVAIRPRGGFFPCFVTDTTLDFTTITGAVAGFNGVDNTVSYGDELLDGTSEKLPEDATRALYEAQPALKRFCGWAGVVAAAVPGDLPPFDGPTRNITVLTYDSEVTLTVPVGIAAPARGGRGRGRGRG